MRKLGRMLGVMLLLLGIGQYSNIVAAQSKGSKDLAHISDQADGVYVVRVGEIMKTSEVREFRSKGGETADGFIKSIGDTYFDLAGIDRPEDMELLIGATKMPDMQNNPNFMDEFYDVQILRTKKNNRDGFDMILELATETHEHKGKEFFEFKRRSDGKRFAYVIDDKNIAWSRNKLGILWTIDSAGSTPTRAEWYRDWEKESKKQVSMTMSGATVEQMSQAPAPYNMLKGAEYIVFGADLDEKLKAQVRAKFSLASEADGAVASAKQLVSLGKMTLEGLADSPRGEQMEKPIKTGLDALESLEVGNKGDVMTAKLDVRVNLLDLLPMLEKTRVAAQRTQALNNLRQVSLSFHNFESAMGKFPSSVMVSDAGKEYSWRIAILPYLEQQELYDQYRFDEEWDSPHNREVTSKMPEIFRHPNAEDDSVYSSWYLVVGEGTIFDTPESSRGFGQITDGSSNTIMAVEAKRKIHWANPRDIEFDPEKMDFGGFSEEGFAVTLADGSTHQVSNNFDRETMQLMLTAADGNVVDMSKLNPPQEGEEKETQRGR